MRAQVCDADDGLPDGMVRLRVPNGLDDGTYTLRETLTAPGGVPGADQNVQLGPGQFQATAPAAGQESTQPATEEPATEQPTTEQPTSEQPAVSQPVVEPGLQPGQLIVIPVNDAGDPLPGACFAVVEFGFEACDDDGNGTVVFDAVPPSPLTLRETAPPPGYAAIADLPFNIEPTGAQLLIPHQPAGATQPTEVPQIQPAETPQAQPAETQVQPVDAKVAAGPGTVDAHRGTIKMATPSPVPAGGSLHKEISGVTSAVTLTTGQTTARSSSTPWRLDGTGSKK